MIGDEFLKKVVTSVNPSTLRTEPFDAVHHEVLEGRTALRTYLSLSNGGRFAQDRHRSPDVAPAPYYRVRGNFQPGAILKTVNPSFNR
jgi:hypothetical protein